MTIACLAWGSLVWDPRELPIEGDWLLDGPELEVEFLRQSENGRITLVLAPSAVTVTSLWVKLSTNDLTSGVKSLAEREGINSHNESKYIGHWSVGEQEPTLIHGLPAWALSNAIAHVIWTSLPPKFNGQLISATSQQIVKYLESLAGETRERAEQYIRMTPKQIQTKYRRDIEGHLNWTSR